MTGVLARGPTPVSHQTQPSQHLPRRLSNSPYTHPAPHLYPYSRPRAQSNSTPHVPTLAYSQPRAMDSSRHHHRPSSPGGRRIVDPARASTGTFGAYDSYYNSAYRSPRSSGDRVNYSTAPSAATRGATRGTYDVYTGRPRRSTIDTRDRPSSTLSVPLRTSHYDRSASPSSSVHTFGDTTKSTYVTTSVPRPSSQQGHHGHGHSHRKIYSIDHGEAVRVDPREVDSRRRDSGREDNYVTQTKAYHTTTQRYPVREVNDSEYSYTDPASMYKDTEPTWRGRSNSIDSRNRRPTSMMDSYGPRTSARDLGGPPVTTRGFDKINGLAAAATIGSMGRTSSLRERGRDSSRERAHDRTMTADSHYRDSDYVHRASTRPESDVRDDRYSHRPDYEERSGYPPRLDDPDVESRGFGIRPSSAGPAVDHYRASHDSNLDRRAVPPVAAYQVDPSVTIPNANDYVPSTKRDEHREPARHGERDYDQDRLRDRDLDRERRKDYDRERDRERDRDRDRDRERDRDTDRYDRERDRDHHSSVLPTAAVALGAAYGAHQLAEHQGRQSERREERRHRDRETRTDSEEEKNYRRHQPSEDSDVPRERHYVDKEGLRECEERPERRREPREQPPSTLDPDEEYRRRVQQELERASGTKMERDGSNSGSDRERRRRRERDAEPRTEPKLPAERSSSVFGQPMTEKPSHASANEDGTSRVRIVSPPKLDKDVEKPKGILRKPTEKFPEDPNPIREGVAPMKDAKKGKDIPPDARWTKIDRRLVNPEALEEAKERFEERMDCVIVLRVLTKDEIQLLADRTREIREGRGKHPSDATEHPASRAPSPHEVAVAKADKLAHRVASSARSLSEETVATEASGDLEHHSKHSKRHGKRHHRRRHSSEPASSSGDSDKTVVPDVAAALAAKEKDDPLTTSNKHKKASLSTFITPVLTTVLDALTQSAHAKEDDQHSRSDFSSAASAQQLPTAASASAAAAAASSRDRERHHRRKSRRHTSSTATQHDDDSDYDSDEEASERERDSKRGREDERERGDRERERRPPRMIEPQREREREGWEREREYYVDPSRR